ncbi:hypothetical protein F3J45_23595 [Pantoea sp. Ap-967]|nr:hypothetical protein [Pantoea sp. Ap-967]
MSRRRTAANTGEAGAIHRVAIFAGKPAPTGELRRGCWHCSLRDSAAPRAGLFPTTICRSGLAPRRGRQGQSQP